MNVIPEGVVVVASQDTICPIDSYLKPSYHNFIHGPLGRHLLTNYKIEISQKCNSMSAPLTFNVIAHVAWRISIVAIQMSQDRNVQSTGKTYEDVAKIAY